MDAKRSPVTFLDTHVIVWLYDALIDKLSMKAQTLIESSELRVSPISLLELQYLYEIKRIKHEPNQIYHYLNTSIQLKTDDLDFLTVIKQSYELTWTRDPFDRIVVASAMALKAPIITADKMIQKHYALALV